MAKFVKTVFTCDVCGESYFTEKEAKACQERCKHLKEIEVFDEKWVEDNPPKFKVGDVVEIVKMKKYNYPHYCFVVKEVYKPKYIQRWYYRGEVGSCDHGIYNQYMTDIVEEIDLVLVMPCEEYNKKVEELIDIYKRKGKAQAHFCRNRKGFEVFIPYNEEKN